MPLVKVGILCAGDREVAPFLGMIQDCAQTEKAMLVFYEGKIENVNVVTLFSGVCKVNAAIAAQILIDTYGCDVIINAGTAGGISQDAQILDTIVSTEAAYHDVAQGILTYFHPWLEDIYFKADDELLQIAQRAGKRLPSQRVIFGRMVTGEAFIEDEQREQIKRKYMPVSVDMETASIAHVCYVNRKPFIAVRTLTDDADHSASEMFESNCVRAAQLSAEFVQMMLSVSGWGEKK